VPSRRGRRGQSQPRSPKARPASCILPIPSGILILVAAAEQENQEEPIDAPRPLPGDAQGGSVVARRRLASEQLQRIDDLWGRPAYSRAQVS